MDRKNVLKDMSATDLRQELLARLRDQIKQHEDEIEGLRQQIRQLTPQPKTVIVTRPMKPTRGRPPGRQPRRNEMPLKDILAGIFRKATEPLRVREIMEQAREAGYVSTANNFAAVVSLTLTNNPEMFERVDRGLYQMKKSAEAQVSSTEPAAMSFG